MKLKNILNRIPRPVKACTCALAVVILAAVYYIALGCPTFSFRQEFRRAEQAHMVGPSQIVDTLDQEYQEFDGMIVGETENGVCFFGRYYNHRPYQARLSESLYCFTYREKTGDITVVAAPNIWGAFWDMHSLSSLPVYIFDDYPDAARAELELTVSGVRTVTYGGTEVTTSFNETFHSTATRNDSSLFLFFLSPRNDKGAYALRLLSDISSGNKLLTDEERAAIIPVAVRLYDSNDELIIEKELTIQAGDNR